MTPYITDYTFIISNLNSESHHIIESNHVTVWIIAAKQHKLLRCRNHFFTGTPMAILHRINQIQKANLLRKWKGQGPFLFLNIGKKLEGRSKIRNVDQKWSLRIRQEIDNGSSSCLCTHSPCHWNSSLITPSLDILGNAGQRPRNLYFNFAISFGTSGNCAIGQHGHQPLHNEGFQALWHAMGFLHSRLPEMEMTTCSLSWQAACWCLQSNGFLPSEWLAICRQVQTILWLFAGFCLS